MKSTPSFRAVSLLLLVFSLAACTPSQYSAADLARLDAKEVKGMVTKQSRGSFILKDRTGEERTYRTGQLTQYIPVDYRSQKGDEVRVVFQKVWERSGHLKLAVLQLAVLKVAEQNKKLPNPITGTLVATGRGSVKYAASILLKMPGKTDALPIYVPWTVKIEAEGQSKGMNDFNLKRIVGKKVQVIADRTPISRGNAYIYVANRIVMN